MTTADKGQSTLKRRLITSALPYVNNEPHLGNLVQVLSADVFARYCRLRGHETLYICGTDEYGTATENRARQEGTTPRELCDRYFAIHRDIYQWFDILFDHFGRTSHPVHTEITQGIFKKINKRNYIAERTTQQLYSERMQLFLADRYVVGICPHCNYENARGDQCENCGTLLDPTDLKEPKSALDGTRPVLRSTRHLYINLPRLLPDIARWLQESGATTRWALNATRMTEAWLRDGLQERAITRDLSWGIPVPLDGYQGKVFYVWFDAPIGYISITAEHTPEWRSWWQNPTEVDLYQFVGKDNIPFHTVIFPATLLGTGEQWTLLHHISSSEYLNYEGGQFSKSRGVGVFGNDAIESGIPSDMWRFYMLYNRPERSDYSFVWEDFYQRINIELIGNVANFFNRLIGFIHRFYQDVLPPESQRRSAPPDTQSPEEHTQFVAERYLNSQMQSAIDEYETLLERVEIRAALRKVCALSDIGNKLFQRYEPWKSPSSSSTCQLVSSLVSVARNLAVMLAPFLPRTATQAAQQLGITEPLSWEMLRQPPPPGPVRAGTPLFKLLEKGDIAAMRARYGSQKQPHAAATPEKKTQATKSSSISAHHFNATVRLIAARIVEVRAHPTADRLYVEILDDGSGNPRQIVSGLVPYYRAEELQGLTVVIVDNLKSARLRGVESRGMLLAAESPDSDVPVVLTVEAPPGTPMVLSDPQASQPNVPHKIPEALKPISIERFSAFPLAVKSHKVVVGDYPLLCEGKPLTVSRIAHGKVS